MIWDYIHFIHLFILDCYWPELKMYANKILI